MKNIFRMLLIAVAVLLAWWMWMVLFPSPKTVIRKRLNQLAKVASFEPKEGNITRLANVAKLASFFADRVEIKMEVPGVDFPAVGTRDDLKVLAMAARSSGRSVEAEFIDIKVELNPDKQSALAKLTLKARISGESDLFLQEMQFNLEKQDGEWVISRIQAIKTLR